MADMADAIAEIRQIWTKKQLQAALLVADDDLGDVEIAKTVGIARQTLYNWKHDSEFAALVGDKVGELNAGMLKLAIAKKRKRLEVLDDLHDKAVQVIHHRAVRHSAELGEGDTPISATKRLFGDVTPAEAATGLLVKQETVNNSGMKTVNWSVDTGLIKEIRALHEQAAKELGQWVERSESSDTVTTTVQVIVSNAGRVDEPVPFVLPETT